MNPRNLRNAPDFVQRGQRRSDIIAFFLAILSKAHKFQAVPAAPFADWARLHDGRLHPVRGHHDIGERQQPALPPEPL